MKLLLLSLLALASTPAMAQCIGLPNGGPPPPNPWPTQVTFSPANPAPGQALSVSLGLPVQDGLANRAVAVSGSEVTITGEMFTLAILPPPPSPIVVALPGLPSGTYAFRVRLVGEQGVACNPLDATLVVGNGLAVATSVPASSPVAVLLLLLGIGVVAARRLRRA